MLLSDLLQADSAEAKIGDVNGNALDRSEGCSEDKQLVEVPLSRIKPLTSFQQEQSHSARMLNYVAPLSATSVLLPVQLPKQPTRRSEN